MGSTPCALVTLLSNTQLLCVLPTPTALSKPGAVYLAAPTGSTAVVSSDPFQPNVSSVDPGSVLSVQRRADRYFVQKRCGGVLVPQREKEEVEAKAWAGGAAATLYCRYISFCLAACIMSEPWSDWFMWSSGLEEFRKLREAM